jgi:hypothetical protein
MITVVEADLDDFAGAGGGFFDGSQFSQRARSRLFHDHMLPGFERRDGDGRQRIVGGRDHDGVDLGMRDRLPPVAGGQCTGNLGSQRFGA